MKTIFEKKSDVEGMFIVSILPSDYEPLLHKNLHTYSSKANLKGFRKGHIPIALLKRIYGRQTLYQIALNIALEACKDHQETSNLPLWGEPLLIANNLEKTTNLTYNETIELSFLSALEPPINLNSITQIQQEAFLIKGAQAQTLEDWAKETQFNYAQPTQVEKSVQEFDILCGTLKGENNFQTTFYVNAFTTLGKDNPTFISQEPHTTLTLNLSPEIDYNLYDTYITDSDGNTNDRMTRLLTNLKGKYHFEITQIVRPKLPAFDQTLFKKVFPDQEIPDLEAFKAAILGSMTNHTQKLADQFLLNQIKEAVIQKIPMEIPHEFLKLKTYNAYNITDQELLHTLQQSLEKSFRWQMIKNKLADENEINITKAELLDYIKQLTPTQLSQLSQQADQIKKLQQDTQKYADPNYQVAYHALLENKILHILKTKIQIQQVNKTIEEFDTILAQQQQLDPNFQI